MSIYLNRRRVVAQVATQNLAAYLEAFRDLDILEAPMQLGEALKQARTGARSRTEVAIAAVC